MKSVTSLLPGIGLALCLAWAGAARAQTNAVSAPPNEVLPEITNEPAVDPGLAETNLPPPEVLPEEETPPAAGEEEAVPAPVKAAPVRQGAQMRGPFGAAGSARFGVRRNATSVAGPKTREVPPEVWRRRLEFGINTARGNSDVLRYDGALSAEKETERNTYFLKASGRYGESDGNTDTQSAAAEARAQHLLTARVYGAAAADAYHDDIADLAYRAQASLSLGRHFIRTERTVFSAEAGPGCVAEDKGGERDAFLAARLGQYLEFQLAPTLRVWESVEYVQNLGEADVFFVNAETGLETVLLADLGLRFTIEDRYDHRPAEGKEANDLLTTTALVWRF